MSPKNCKPVPITLYSSTNFAPGSVASSKIIKDWKLDDKLKLLIKFVSKYDYNGQTEYFKSIVSLDVSNDSGILKKSNIRVRDICFKNELNVSASSQTQDYQYLYDISCSSADNNDSSSSSSSISTDLDSLIDKQIEKEIATNVKAFVESNAFGITWSQGVTTITLDVSLFTAGSPASPASPVFDTVKNTIKYKFSDSCTNTSESSCSSSSSSSCSSKPNKILKYLMISAVMAFVVMLIMKLFKKHGYGSQYDSLNNLQNGLTEGVNGLINKVGGLFTKSTPYVAPEPTPYGTPEPTPYVAPEPTPYVAPEPTPYVAPEPTPIEVDPIEQ